MNEKNYLALLHKIWLSHKKLHFIFKDNCNFSDFYNSISSDLLKKYCFTPKQIDLILNNKIKYNIAMIEKTLKSREVKVITFFDINYPEILKNIPNPPFLFYLRWKIDSSPKIAVVWSRNITNYWKDIISDIVWPLSSYFTIVSWGAAWCDSFSHKIALNNENTTISVIWTWIDVDYPINNKKLIYISKFFI